MDDPIKRMDIRLNDRETMISMVQYGTERIEVQVNDKTIGESDAENWWRAMDALRQQVYGTT